MSRVSATDPKEHAVTEMDKPAEASLYDDPATADLSAKVTEAWADFSRAFAAALTTLPAGSRLDVTLDPTASGVEGAVYTLSVTPADGDLLAFAVSNANLPPGHRLPREAIAALVALGWSPPGVMATGGERFALRLPTAQATRVAAIMSRTLRDIYGAPHPAFLVYALRRGVAAGADTAPAVEAPPLGAARLMVESTDGLELPTGIDLNGLSLREKVTTVVAAMLHTDPDSLPVDNDGDIGIRSGSAMVFVRVRDNPPLVDVFSPVLTGVDASEQLYVRLSELTHRMPIGRLYLVGDTVWASVPVFGREFQATHLMLAVQVMTGLADELDDRLHGEFGGKRFFVDTDRASAPPTTEHEGDGRSGPYL